MKKLARLGAWLQRAGKTLGKWILGSPRGDVKAYVYRRTQNLIVKCEVCGQPIRWDERWLRGTGYSFWCESHRGGAA